MADDLSPAESAAIRHWSTYGQNGEPSEHRVTASEWKTTPFHTPVTSPWSVALAPTELTKLLNGFLPRGMEDKWFVYADGPDVHGDAVVHMCRSWTGYRMVEVKIKVPCRDGDGEGEGADEVDARIVEITYESSPERCRGQTEEGAKTMAREVCRWVMEVKLPG